jgi:hypothetical protein
MSTSMTVWPFPVNRLTTALPIPEAEPVTT